VQGRRVGIIYKTGIHNDGDKDDSNERLSKGIRLNKRVCKNPCVRCGCWDHTKLCKSCPQSKDYQPYFDELYEEWEVGKYSSLEGYRKEHEFF
jgi:hypothetical protein